MPRFTVEIDGLWCTWSTVVDAPVTALMPKEDYEEWYRQRHEPHQRNKPDEIYEQEMDLFEKKMERTFEKVEETGCSNPRYEDADEVIAFNRAGPNEENLSKEELIERFEVEDT